jgi:hypothetical protein
MSYVKPTFHAARHNLTLSLELSLEMPFQPMIKKIANAIGAQENRRVRKDKVQATVAALDVILANLLRAHYRDPKLSIGAQS